MIDYINNAFDFRVVYVLLIYICTIPTNEEDKLSS